MSIQTLSAVAVARNTREPNRSDVGDVTHDSGSRDDRATLPQLLVKQIPTGLVASYTALTAAIVTLVPAPSAEQPTPDRLLDVRWAAFGVLVLASMTLTYISYRQKAGPGARQPVAEVVGVGVAATGWGLVVPESPLLAQASGIRGTAIVLLIAFVATVANLIVAAHLRTRARPHPRVQEQPT